MPAKSRLGTASRDILARMDNNRPATGQPLAALFAGGAVLMLTLLLAHPHESLHSFAEMVDFEISHRVANSAVHGCVLGLLILLLAAHVSLARLVAPLKWLAIVAVTAFGLACVLMTASLVLDGFVTPTLAIQFRAAKDAALQQSIQAQIQFCGTCIRTLMPMALVSFAGSALAWVGPLVRLGGRGRAIGLMGGAMGVVIAVMISTAAPQALNHVLMGGLFLIALWQLALAIGVSGSGARALGQ